MSVFRAIVAAGFITAAAGSAAMAQSGRYYLTDESGVNSVWQVQGGSLINTWPTLPAGPRMGPIIVDGNTNTVRYVQGGLIGGQSGQGFEHNFAGTPLNPLSITFAAHPGLSRVIDAGFDGVNTYVVGFNGDVLRYNADFSGPGAFVFNAGTAVSPQGITFDSFTNTIWISDYDFNAGATGGRVRQYSLSGVELFSFPVRRPGIGDVFSERNTALAYDQTDDTFWMNAHVETGLTGQVGELWQFDRAGNFLQAINPRPGLLYWGGEIRLIPAPSAAGLLVLASIGARRRRR